MNLFFSLNCHMLRQPTLNKDITGAIYQLATVFRMLSQTNLWSMISLIAQKSTDKNVVERCCWCKCCCFCCCCFCCCCCCRRFKGYLEESEMKGSSKTQMERLRVMVHPVAHSPNRVVYLFTFTSLLQRPRCITF